MHVKPVRNTGRFLENQFAQDYVDNVVVALKV